MNKETKYIVFIVIALVLAGLVYFLVVNSRAEVVTAPIDTNSEIINNDSVPAVVETPDVTAPIEEPVYTKTIEIEFMDAEDKKKIGLDDSMQVQVLDRAEDGTVLAYRIITEANPVIDKFGN